MTFDIGDYRAVELIAAGGSAQVWLGIRISSGTRVAMKVYPADQLDAARREAALAAAVDHPHVVRVLDVVCQPDRAVLVTEYAAGGDLADLLERRGRLTPSETLTVLLPLAAALATAHEREIVHGDLSAANVVFDRAGRPLLADLGAGRAAAEAGRPVFATPVDAAPELARGGPPTPATDMFSLGSLALACLTGRHAWPADDLRDVLIQAAGGQWPDPGDDAAPPAVVSLVRALLEHDPERRPGAATVVIALKAAGRPEPVDLRIRPDQPIGSGSRPTGQVGTSRETGQIEVTDAGDRARHGRDGDARGPQVGRDPALHPPGRVAVGNRVGSAPGHGDHFRGQSLEEVERRARSRAVTRRRADAVQPAEQAVTRPSGLRGLRRGAGPGGARRPLVPTRVLRIVLQVVVCLVVIGVAGAAGLWWAGWGRIEPAAVADAVGGGPLPVGPSPVDSAPGTPITSVGPTSVATTVGKSRADVGGAATANPRTRAAATPSRPTPLVTTSAPTSATARPEDWPATVRSLDEARARALVRRDTRLLDSVYTRDAAARSTDAGTIGTMLAKGLRVSGAGHVMRTVRILGRNPIRLAVQDSLPSYSILDASGRVVGRTAARADAPRVLVLVPTSGGYRISQVQSA